MNPSSRDHAFLQLFIRCKEIRWSYGTVEYWHMNARMIKLHWIIAHEVWSQGNNQTIVLFLVCVQEKKVVLFYHRN